MDRLLLYVTVITLMCSIKSCHNKSIEIRKLNRIIKEIPDDRKEVWIESCRLAVDLSCDYSICDVLSIEEIQDKVCQFREKQ